MSTIPTKWKVRITEANREVLEQWRIKQPGVEVNPGTTCLVPNSLNRWLISDVYDGSYLNWGDSDRWEEITYEQFQQHVLNQNTKMKTYNTKISDLRKIHDVACAEWKSKIKTLITDPFADYIVLTQTQVDEMFKAATKVQRPVLVEVFGEPAPKHNFKEGELIWVWDNDQQYPSVRKFIKMFDSRFECVNVNGSGTFGWGNAAPFNNGQLPDQFKHLLNNQ